MDENPYRSPAFSQSRDSSEDEAKPWLWPNSLPFWMLCLMFALITIDEAAVQAAKGFQLQSWALVVATGISSIGFGLLAVRVGRKRRPEAF